MERVREITARLNEMQEKAMESAEQYRQNIGTLPENATEAQIDKAYLEANRETFGAEYALEKYNKNVYEKAQAMNRKGIEFEDYMDAYFAQKDTKSDKDENGDTVYLSASKNKKQAIDAKTEGMSTEDRQLLYEAFGVSEKVW